MIDDHTIKNVMGTEWVDVRDAQLASEYEQIEQAKASGVPFMRGSLQVEVTNNGYTVDLGEVGTKAVTSAGCEWFVRALVGSTPSNGMRYHGMGTDDTAFDVAQTGLVIESNQTSTPTTRPTGTIAVGDNTNVYRTTCQITSTGTQTIFEHGIFNEPVKANPAYMLDRTVISPGLPLVTSTIIKFVYELWFVAGG